jgi:hypothetical protein
MYHNKNRSNIKEGVKFILCCGDVFVLRVDLPGCMWGIVAEGMASLPKKLIGQ